MLNSPQNPSVMLFSRADLKLVAYVAFATDILVLSDEVYEHLVFDAGV